MWNSALKKKCYLKLDCLGINVNHAFASHVTLVTLFNFSAPQVSHLKKGGCLEYILHFSFSFVHSCVISKKKKMPLKWCEMPFQVHFFFLLAGSDYWNYRHYIA